MKPTPGDFFCATDQEGCWTYNQRLNLFGFIPSSNPTILLFLQLFIVIGWGERRAWGKNKKAKHFFLVLKHFALPRGTQCVIFPLVDSNRKIGFWKYEAGILWRLYGWLLCVRQWKVTPGDWISVNAKDDGCRVACEGDHTGYTAQKRLCA